jgi:hypothetical protein
MLIAPRDRGTSSSPASSNTSANGSNGFAVFETTPAGDSTSNQTTGHNAATATQIYHGLQKTSDSYSAAGIETTSGQARLQPAMPGITPPGRSDLQSSEQSLEYQIQLEPPGPQRLFQIDSEKSLFERMRQEARERPIPERLIFPDEPVVRGGPTHPRPFPPSLMQVEPNYTCYGRLFFEQKNFERYGWDLCFITPFVSAGAFFADLALLPMHIGADPLRKCDCNSGYCLPGDPVPLLLYPPEITITGSLLEAGTAIALIAIFP